MKKNMITINLHYKRADGDYSGWNAWMWTLTNGGKEYAFKKTADDMVATIQVDGHTTTSVSFIIRKGQWETQEFAERRVDVSTVVSGTVHCYVEADCEACKIVAGTDVVKGNKLLSAEFDYDSGAIKVVTAAEISGVSDFRLYDKTGKDSTVEISGLTGEKGSYELVINHSLDLVDLYRYAICFGGFDYSIKTTTVYASKRFAREFTYSGNDLGAAYAENSTTFKVWAPTAESVRVALYKGGTADVDDLISSVLMKKQENGTWSVRIAGDCHGLYYTYIVKVHGKNVEAVDPYTRSTGINGCRGMVLNLAATNPDGWDKDANPNPLKSYTDAVLYELHVRDFSIDESSGVSAAHRGKFLGLTELGTKTSGGVPTGLDYLKKLGITHLHLLPVYDYGSVDESRLDIPQFNWGYDPVNYNTPEGSYSTDPYNGDVRVAEMKQMIKALHDNGISVVMDVVYNHVFEAGKFGFNMIVPGYFSRFNPDGSYSNGSGCGNDTASERAMVRKYIVDSIVYWKEEYHIDGFRFDLVGLLDATTINALVDAVHAKHPDVIFYGEGWAMNTAVEPGNYMATQLNATRTPEFAYFSDTIRDLLAGRNGETLGFVSGATGQEDPLFHCVTATTGWCPKPTQTVNYASCHDNYTLMDKLYCTKPKATREQLVRMNNLAAAIYMTSQGIPFIHAGEEFLREKQDENGKRIENSYNASDYVNKIRWSGLEETEKASVVEYYRGLIRFRKAHAALRLATAEAVKANVTYKWISNELVMFAIKGKDSVPQEVSDGILVIFNANSTEKIIDLKAAGLAGIWDVCINDKTAGTDVLETIRNNSVTVAPVSAMVLVKHKAE